MLDEAYSPLWTSGREGREAVDGAGAAHAGDGDVALWLGRPVRVAVLGYRLTMAERKNKPSALRQTVQGIGQQSARMLTHWQTGGDE